MANNNNNNNNDSCIIQNIPNVNSLSSTAQSDDKNLVPSDDKDQKKFKSEKHIKTTGGILLVHL